MPACLSCGAPLADEARFCSSCGTAVRPPSADRERKLATVVFADLAGSTAYAAARDPEFVRDTLDRYYEAMTAIVVEHAGRVDKFIGDAVVAIFGAPIAREDHAERALAAALRMQQRFDELFGADLALRIGVNTGELVVGRAGSQDGYVTGDAVNVAARLEQAAPAGEVLVGERTVATAGGAFEFGESQIVEAKGKPDGVPARRLIRQLSEVRPRGRFGATFVGRDSELELLHEAWRRCVAERRPQLVVVVGDPGVGKTTLVSQFRSRLAETASIRVGRCASYGRNAAFNALADLLGDDADGVVERRPILAMTLGQAAPAEIDPRVAAEQLRAAWADLVTELADASPQLLVVEDIHWASAPLIAVIERVLVETVGAVLVVATSRPEHPPLPEPAQIIDLRPLSHEDIDALLSRLVGGELPAPARSVITRIAEGNPFFLEEILAALIDRGALARHEHGWEWDEGSGPLDVPDTVQSLLAARIDALPEPAKRVLQVAAVIGRVGDAAAIRELSEGGDHTEVVARDLLRPHGDALIFKHALTREVAYSSLSRAQRAVMHANYASWLAENDGEDASPGLLADHYWRAVDPAVAELAWRGREDELRALETTALAWLRRAADEAFGRYDIEAALRALGQATQLAPQDAALWRAISRANALRYAGPEYWEATQRAIELTSDPQLLAEAYAELSFESTIRGAMWPRRPSPDLLRGWYEQALSMARPGSRAMAQAILAQALLSDDPADVDRAISAAEELGDIDIVSYSYYARSAFYTESGDYSAAHEWSRRRERFAATITDPDHQANIYQACVSSAIATGRFAEAYLYVDRMAEICERLTPHHAVHVMGTRISLSEAIGDWATVRALQPEIERIVSANVVTPCSYNGRLLLSCAVACEQGGDTKQAERLERETLALDLEDYRMWFDPLRAQLALWRGDQASLSGLAPHAESWAMPLYVHCFGIARHLDVLIALGKLDAAAELARQRCQTGSYLEPFALRAIGMAHDDAELQLRAEKLFQAMGITFPARRAAVTG